MNGKTDKQALGEWADQGYFLKAYDDHIITVCYKDGESKELAAFNQTQATPEELQAVCRRHHERLTTVVGATQ